MKYQGSSFVRATSTLLLAHATPTESDHTQSFSSGGRLPYAFLFANALYFFRTRSNPSNPAFKWSILGPYETRTKW